MNAKYVRSVMESEWVCILIWWEPQLKCPTMRDDIVSHHRQARKQTDHQNYRTDCSNQLHLHIVRQLLEQYWYSCNLFTKTKGAFSGHSWALVAFFYSYILFIYFFRFIKDLKIYSNQRQQLLNAHSIVVSIERTQRQPF